MIQIGKPVATVGEEPLEHLVACHGRILERLQTMERVGDNLESQPQAALNALENVFRYFDTSGRLHTLDEEESVFPRMRPHLSETDLAYLQSLEEQHRESEQVYDDLVRLARELREAITPERVAEYKRLTARFCELYRSHIESENTVMVRLGRGCLDENMLATIRTEMRERRGRD